MVYRIAICDDSVRDVEFVQGILNHWALQRQISVQAEVFSSAERFLSRYAGDKNWDILLLDIEIGAMDGVTLTKKVRRMCFESPGLEAAIILSLAAFPCGKRALNFSPTPCAGPSSMLK